MTKIIGIIPCHLASVRFPRKILFPFAGVPMIEHVRRRALMSERLDDVIVATCDTEIAECVRSFGGKVVMTGDHHLNGTSRAAEAVASLDCTHVVLLQGDEPLLLPDHVDAVAKGAIDNPNAVACNATGPIEDPSELDRHSFVKCAVGADNRISYCFRRSPSMADFEVQQSYIRKILGLFVFQRQFLIDIADAPRSVVETAESIEQMRIIEGGHLMISVPVDISVPSVNEPHEADIVLEYMKQSPVQQDLLERVLAHGTDG